MERELANEFEALEDNFDETKKPKLEYNQVQFNKLIKKVLPISFKQFEKQEKNKPIADYITKAYNCYIDRINQVSNIKDIDKFFEVVDSCKGRVELVTGEGDRLNLKSKLSQYVSLANIFSGGEIPELEIVAYEKEDIDKLLSFMING